MRFFIIFHDYLTFAFNDLVANYGRKVVFTDSELLLPLLH